MNILEYKFENQIIEFDITGNDVMINATEMAKPFGKRPIDFLKQENTKAFIEELKSSIAAKRSDPQSLRSSENAVLLDEIIVRSERGGDANGITWMHKQLALKFAAWLSPKFEVWIFDTIDKLVFGNLHRANEALKRKAELQDKKDAVLQKLSENSDYQALLKVNADIKIEDKQLRETNNNQLELFRG